MNDILDKDKLIISLRNQVRELLSKCNALEQENALLNNELKRYERYLLKQEAI